MIDYMPCKVCGNTIGLIVEHYDGLIDSNGQCVCGTKYWKLVDEKIKEVKKELWTSKTGEKL